jgi:hypothetical protein
MSKTPLRPSKTIPDAATKLPISASPVEARYSDLPLKDLITIRLRDLELRNIDMQKALDFPRPNVIAMIKKGDMRLPEAKCIKTADLLQVDRTFLLRKVIAENNPELWDAITSVLGEQLVTANELALIKFVRDGLDGHDADLMGSYDFGKTIAPVLADAFKHESALARAALDRIDSKGRK